VTEAVEHEADHAQGSHRFKTSGLSNLSTLRSVPAATYAAPGDWASPCCAYPAFIGIPHLSHAGRARNHGKRHRPSGSGHAACPAHRQDSGDQGQQEQRPSRLLLEGVGSGGGKNQDKSQPMYHHLSQCQGRFLR